MSVNNDEIELDSSNQGYSKDAALKSTKYRN